MEEKKIIKKEGYELCDNCNKRKVRFLFLDKNSIILKLCISCNKKLLREKTIIKK